jgi:hypothetical protein
LFFYPLLKGKIPIPSDTIVGMYHPYRDLLAKEHPQGLPFKNPLITDPVRQQYVWRKLAIDNLKAGSLPLWNPYSFSGTPLLANFQSGILYPFNILFFLLPFNLAWSILISIQPLLAAFFLYLYLRNRRISPVASFLGSFSFAFCGFSIAWMEWNTVLQTGLWLPLILLAKEKLLDKISLKWSLILIFGEISMFLAGHLQVFFYAFMVSNLYLVARFMQLKKGKHLYKEILPFLLIGLIVVILTSIQWLPTLKFILVSARDADQSGFLKEGWFIPWQNIIQFLSPDFFGNPATGNYWGVWNYGEFIGYIGIIPLIFSFYGLVFRQDKKILFFGTLLFFSIFLAFPTWFANVPFILELPFLSTSQPTRLIYVIDLSLCILTALGFEQFRNDKNIPKIVAILLPMGMIYLLLYFFTINPSLWQIHLNPDFAKIAQKNLILPIGVYIISSIFMISYIKNTGKNAGTVILTILLILTITDIFRFGWKFLPFSDGKLLYPQTQIISYLNKNIGIGRLMSLDRRILPANFTVYHNLQDVSGYDPLYLADYNRLVGAWNKGRPDIGFSAFNRIVTPTNYRSFMTDLFGISYVLNYGALKDTRMEFIMSEGETYLYRNVHAFPRVFLVENVIKVSSSQEEMSLMYELKDKLQRIAVTSEDLELPFFKLGQNESVQIIHYADNQIEIEANTNIERLVVLSDIYYPTWKVSVNGYQTKIYKVDYLLRGVVVPSGNNRIIFTNNLI